MKLTFMAPVILLSAAQCFALTPMVINSWSLSAWADGPVEGINYGGYSSGTATQSGAGPGDVTITSTGTETDGPFPSSANATASFSGSTGVGGLYAGGTFIGNVEINVQLPPGGFSGDVSASVTFTIPYDSMLSYIVTNTDPSYATITTGLAMPGNGEFFPYGGPATFTISDNQPHVGTYSNGEVDIYATAVELPEPAAAGLIPLLMILNLRRHRAIAS